MDERLKGLQVKDITLIKVDKLLTQKERLSINLKMIKSHEVKYYSIYSVDSLNTLQREVEQITNRCSDVELSIIDNEVEVSYYVNKHIRVHVLEFFRDKWREEIKIHNEKEKEYQLYLELKNKFDNTSGEPSEH